MIDAFGVNKAYGPPVDSDGHSHTYNLVEANGWAKAGHYVTSRNTVRGPEYRREAIMAPRKRPSRLRMLLPSKRKPIQIQYKDGNGQINPSKYDSPAYGRAQRKAVVKRDNKDPKPLHPLAVGAATAGGALAGQSAYMSVTPFNNHVMKPYFSRKMAEAGPDSEQARIWREWNKPQEPRVRGKHSGKPWVDPGFRGGEKPNTEERQRPFNRRASDKEAQSNTKRAAWHGSEEFHRKFPRGLPGWRTHRALSWAGKGLPGHATGAALMGTGALAAYKVASHQPKSKVNKGLPSIARGAGYRKIVNPEAREYLLQRMAAHDKGRAEADYISRFRNGVKEGTRTQRFAGGMKRKRKITFREVAQPEGLPKQGWDGAEAFPRKEAAHTRVVDEYRDGSRAVTDRVEGKPTYVIRSKIGKSFFQYVPKSQMTLKTIVRDPGFLVPVGGVTLAGAGGATLAARKYRKRKKK